MNGRAVSYFWFLDIKTKSMKLEMTKEKMEGKSVLSGFWFLSSGFV
jgi:hypothetical protein